MRSLLAALGTLLLPLAVSAQTTWSVTDYYVNDKMPLTSLDGLWNGITHLALGDFHVSADGSLRYTFRPEDSFPAAVAAAHEHNAKALIILSDTTSSDDLAGAFSGHRAKLLTNIAGLIRAYHFDGIQVDWERSFPYTHGAIVRSETQARLGEFFQALRAKLGGGVLIMADAFPAGGPWGVVTQTQWNSAIPYLDRLAVMTYDIVRQVSGNFSWFNSPLFNGETALSAAGSVDQSVMLFLASPSAVSARKLMLSIPFYGFSYTGVRGPRQHGGRIDRQSNYSDLARSHKLAAATFDSSAQVPWLPVNNGYLSFENERSIAAKIHYARTKGLGGWMVFNLFADYVPGSQPQHPLLAAIYGAKR